MFPTIYDESKKIVTCAGSRYKPVYQSRFNKYGQLVVEKKGQEDLYSLIQANAESVDINVLVEKYKNGDLSVLNKSKGLFLDTSDFPEDYFEMRNKAMDIENVFKKLPVEVKQLFGNDVNKFIGKLGDKDVVNMLLGLGQNVNNDNNIVNDNSIDDDTNDNDVEEKSTKKVGAKK